MNRREAFIRQARSDHRVFLRLSGDGAAEGCHAIHYLQMTGEKLAKALLAGDEGEPTRSHRSFSKLTSALKRQRTAAALGYANFQQFKAFLDRCGPLIGEVERLAPALAGEGPNAEYPWRASLENENSWIAPAGHEFELGRRLKSPEGQALLKLVRAILDRFDRII